MAIAMRGKSWISLIVILTLVWTGSALQAPRASAAAATPFSDVAAGHWAEKHIAKLALQGLLKGNEGKFSPNAALSRQEAVLIAIRFMGLEDKVDSSAVSFPDSFYVDNYFKTYINFAFKQNLIDMAEEFELASAEAGKNWGSSPATREWVARLLVRAIGMDADASAAASTATSFADNSAIDPDYLGYVNVAVQHGLVKGTDGNKFDPKGTLTRAAAATLFSRAESQIATSFSGQASGIWLKISPTELKMLHSDGTITTYGVTDSTLFSRADSESLLSESDLTLYGKAIVIGSGDGTAAYAEQLDDTAQVQAVEGELVVVNSSKSLISLLAGEDVSSYSFDSEMLPVVTDSEGSSIALGDIPAGAKLKLLIDGFSSSKRVVAVSLTTSTVNKTGSGTIVGYDSTLGTLTVKDDATAVAESRNIAATATIQKDGQYVGKSELKAGSSVSYKVVDGQYTDIVITKSPAEAVTGYFFKADTTEQTIQYTSALNSSDIKAKFYDDDITVSITGVADADLDDLYKGDQVELTLDESGYVVAIQVTNRSIKTLTGGTISSYVADDGILVIKDSDGKSTAYSLGSGTRYSYNGNTITKATAVSYFIKGRKADIGYSDSNLYYIDIISKYSGTVLANNTTSRVLTLELADGSTQTLYYASPAVELFGNSSATYASIAVGDSVTAYLTSDLLNVVTIQVNKTAQLEVVSVDTSANKLTAKNATTGVETTWTIDSSIKFYGESGAASTLSALTAGMTINAALLGNTLKSVQTVRVTLGQLESVNAAASTLTVLPYGGASTVVNTTSTVVVTKNGATFSSLSNLQAGDRVEVRLNEAGQTVVTVLAPVTKTVWYVNASTGILNFLKSSTGVSDSVTVSSSAYIHSGDTTIALSSLGNGDSVTVYSIRSKAVEIVKN
ncbi:S-layer homology domain-containing protein [Cohnella fermenti]|uniref:S-layer homology domain-containing protein n=1 Tax=Cohnella fermenti TaxID=2565925 RepID=A0A4S4C0R7_9BACL|nr:S-layer homology domain-containing protein [Cohnella fermenti]THF81200.1 S-layer homology domain-containing protein [Cohnella fermenti]